jgi:archaeal cell division control protein 6
MRLFDDVLGDNESLFLNEIALDFDFMPKQIQYRENENQLIAVRIKPLFQKRNGSNLLIHGPPGIGKTLAVKKVLEELEEVSDEITVLYINCWQNNSSYKVALEICKQLGYRRTINKNTNELLEEAIQILNKTSSVLVLDEIDKVNDLDFLYTYLEKVYRKTIILLTNYKEVAMGMDERLKSRLLPELLEFRPYNSEETRGILDQRKQFAFVSGVWDEDAFEDVVKKTWELKDMRRGLHLLKETGNCAELRSSRKIELEDAKKAISKLTDFSQKNKNEVDTDSQKILDLIKSEHKIGDLFKLYEEQGGNISYKTFTRRIETLEKGKFILTKRENSKEGQTTIISRIGDKKLSDF